jgi:Ca2+-binding EF-hand superfamily protein
MQTRTETLDELQEIFKRIDDNGDGRVSFDEFRALLLEMGDQRTGDALRVSFERIDADRNGRIDFEELRAWLCPVTHCPDCS